jgi:GT2 family glycosyltransferase
VNIAEITVVVVTWNGIDLLPSCLDALQAQTLQRERYRIVVVDNASSDGTAAMLTAQYPEVEVLELPRNLGFAGGCSAALAAIASPWVALVNNDAVVDPSFLDSLLAATDGADDVAAWAARVVLHDDSSDGLSGPRLNSTGIEIQRDGNGRDRDYLAPVDTRRASEDVFGFSGSAALLRTAAVASVGGFDPAYFLYYEDADLSWRLRLGGWRIAYCHNALATHRHAATSSIGSDLFVYHNERNRLFTLVKNAPAGLATGIMLRHPVGTARRLIASDPAERHRGVVRIKAYRDVLLAMPRLVRQRRSMPLAMRRRRRAVAGLLVPAAQG